MPPSPDWKRINLSAKTTSPHFLICVPESHFILPVTDGTGGLACCTDAFPCSVGTGGLACCTSSNQCEAKEGDCDSDDECVNGLKCGQDNCDPALGFPANYDCCYDPDPCADGTGGASCCTSSSPCGAGYGDCDTDDECIGSLKCGQGSGLDNNCDNSLGFGDDYDCCYEPEG